LHVIGDVAIRGSGPYFPAFSNLVIFEVLKKLSGFLIRKGPPSVNRQVT